MFAKLRVAFYVSSQPPDTAMSSITPLELVRVKLWSEVPSAWFMVSDPLNAKVAVPPVTLNLYTLPSAGLAGMVTVAVALTL